MKVFRRQRERDKESSEKWIVCGQVTLRRAGVCQADHFTVLTR